MRVARVDKNQAEIVQALRRIGAEVQSLATIGKGCPDLLVSFRGSMYLLEVKNGKLPPSERQLTPDQKVWIAKWRAPVGVVTTPEEAIAVINRPTG